MKLIRNVILIAVYAAAVRSLRLRVEIAGCPTEASHTSARGRENSTVDCRFGSADVRGVDSGCVPRAS